MKSMLTPDKACDKIQDIEVSWLKARGITGVICDLDNTLAGYSEPLPSDDVAEWIGRLRENGIDFMIISNNNDRRVSRYCEPLGIKYLGDAKKPKPESFLKAAGIMKKTPDEIAMVGDQIFTDVRGGNRCGMTTIIVNPVKSNIIFAIRRLIETPFIRAAKRKESWN